MYRFASIRGLCILAAVSLSLTGMLNADTLVLSSGEKLTGSLVEQKDGLITFNHPVLGQIKVEAKNASVEVAPPVTPAQAAAVAQAPAAAPAEEKPAEPPAPEPPKSVFVQARDNFKSWFPEGMDGKISAGYSYVDTGDTKENLSLGFNLNYKRDKDLYAFNAFYDYSTSKNTAGVKTKDTDKYGADLSYTHDLNERWLIKNKLSYLRDEVKEIHHQVEDDLGIGYRIIKNEKMEWTANFGPAVRYTDATGLNDNWYFLLFAEENFKYHFNKTLRLDHLARYSADPTDSNNYT